MVNFFEVMCQACVKVKLLQRVPPRAELLSVAKGSFRMADINSDGDISTRGWLVGWLVAKALVRTAELLRAVALECAIHSITHGVCHWPTEFIAWARKHVLTRSLLKEFKTAKKGAAKSVNKNQIVNLSKQQQQQMKKQRRANRKRLKVCVWCATCENCTMHGGHEALTPSSCTCRC